MILVSYDGSPDAQTAIDCVAALVPGTEATVLTVWEPFIDALAHGGAFGVGAGMGMAGSIADAQDIDAVSRDAALATATDGAERAIAAGLRAQPRSAIREGTVADTILAAAQETGAQAVVVGTRGRGGVKSFLLGSVSHAVVLHAERPVLVVPSPVTATNRPTTEDRRDTVPA